MLTFFNSLTKKKETFRPLQSGKATMYNCGPTVYDYVHIGNLRYFVFTDLLRRWLEYKNFDVLQVMNITDVGHMLADADEGEDKMEVSAKKAGQSPQEVAKFYTDAFFKDLERLNIRRASTYPRASEHVPEMIAMIQTLLEKGCAYKVEENAYFDISSFPSYGKLSGNVLTNLNPGARIDVRTEKKHPADFALWIHNPQHLLQWETPWGKGYPGWHIECSAMAAKYLGETIDIHTGGEDNKFPHHECEIAQSECSSGLPFVKTWLHVTHLLIDGEKMSKSKGNFYTLSDLLAKGYDSRSVRYLLLGAHYRQALNFTFAGLEAACGGLDRLDSFADAVRFATPKEAGSESKETKSALQAFTKALDDDCNVAEALAVLFEFVRTMNEKFITGTVTKKEKRASELLLQDVGLILGFTFGHAVQEQEIPASIIALIEKRDEARREHRYAESDRLRDELKEKGYSIEDTSDGSRHIKRV